MKNQKMSKAASIAHRKRLQGVPFATKLSPGSHRVAETSDPHKCKTARLSGHTLKPELAGLIEKTLQEADVSGTEKGAQRTEEDLSCLKEIKKKVYDNKRDKEIGREQDESVKVEISEKPVRKHKNPKYKMCSFKDYKSQSSSVPGSFPVHRQGGANRLWQQKGGTNPAIKRDAEISGPKAKADAEMEDVLLEMKKDLSFVEIDLRDRVEEKTEEILTEEKQHEKEEESPETLPESSWLCCFPIWMRQKKRKEKQE
ncbi:uncharacterized protein LOC117045394 [Lacerta agilis]|uniref:uncharacterized protein LOC117045394 n=1 Tax=Lacerta agilis TaxID=80427 RepID=UPI0014199DC3|nr:uncharacterized protein LOC117045394 [Lacerta agilis]